MSAHKIIILDNNQQRRDALKSMVVEWGHTPFIFEKEFYFRKGIPLPGQPQAARSGSGDFRVPFGG
jgi:hypothetical protein